jgi:hypothetical protein
VDNAREIRDLILDCLKQIRKLPHRPCPHRRSCPRPSISFAPRPRPCARRCAPPRVDTQSVGAHLTRLRGVSRPHSESVTRRVGCAQRASGFAVGHAVTRRGYCGWP